MGPESFAPAAAPALPRPHRAGTARATLAVVFLLGALLPIQRYIVIAGSNVNACAADLMILPALVLLRREWLHSRGLGWWLGALWVMNLLAWIGSLSILEPISFLREVMKVVTCYLFALAGFAVGSHPRTERALVRGMIFSALPIAVIAIQAFFTRVPAVFIPDGRVSGLFTDPNAFGTYLAMLLTLVMSLRADLLAIPLLLGALVVTFSRTGFVGAGLALVLGATHARMRRYLPILALGAVVVVLVWSNIWNHTVGMRVLQYDASLDERKSLWNRGFEVAAAHPFLGIGRGNWETVSGQNTIPHNTVLSVAVDIGFFGLGVFLLPPLIWVGQGLRRRATRPWAIVLLTNLVCGMSVSFDNFLPFWLCTGVLAAQVARAAGQRQAARAHLEAQALAGAAPLAQAAG